MSYMSTMRTGSAASDACFLCAGALGGGMALARYTDIAREDLSLRSRGRPGELPAAS